MFTTAELSVTVSELVGNWERGERLVTKSPLLLHRGGISLPRRERGKERENGVCNLVNVTAATDIMVQNYRTPIFQETLNKKLFF